MVRLDDDLRALDAHNVAGQAGEVAVPDDDLRADLESLHMLGGSARKRCEGLLRQSRPCAPRHEPTRRTSKQSRVTASTAIDWQLERV